MNIVIPTYKRSHNLTGFEYFTSAKYVLPESQKDDYLKVLPQKKMIVIPDSEDGSIPKKRNWILKNIPRPLCMIDDDVKYLLYMEGRPAEKTQFISFRKLPKDLLIPVLEQYTQVAKEFGAKMWGVSQRTAGDEREFKEWKPFSLVNITLGPFQVHLRHDLLFDERMGTKDDYDMALQQLQKYGMLLRVEKLAYDCDHGVNSGGIVSMRTRERETEYCKAIMRKWGEKVIKYKLPGEKMGDLLNGSVSVPIKGI
jgi:hypothetical protein